MTIEVAEKPHAVLGPSGWHTWGSCPGSVPLSEGLPNNVSSYAKEGTAAHQVLEMCLTEGKDAEDYLGTEIAVEGEVFVVDNDMADAVNSAIDIVKSYADEGSVLMVEQSVPLAFMTGEQDAEGTCDVSLITEKGTHLHIFDYKHGKGVMVYASEKALLDAPPMPNGQLAMYALGWLQKHGFPYEDVEKVTLHVLQPRLEWHDEYTLPVVELRNFEDVVRRAAGDVEMNRQVHLEGNDLDLNPSEKACKFCKARAHCPALRNQISTSLATIASNVSDFEDLTLPKQAAAVTVNEGVSSEKLAEFLRAVPLIEAAIEAVRAEVERRLFAGQDVPGFYLGVGRKGNRKWKNEETALKELTKSGRLKMAEAQAKKPISPAQAEKLLKKSKPKVWEKIEELFDQSDGKPSVCKVGDKNEPYKIASDVSDFENLDAAPSLESIMD